MFHSVPPSESSRSPQPSLRPPRSGTRPWETSSELRSERTGPRLRPPGPRVRCVLKASASSARCESSTRNRIGRSSSHGGHDTNGAGACLVPYSGGTSFSFIQNASSTRPRDGRHHRSLPWHAVVVRFAKEQSRLPRGRAIDGNRVTLETHCPIAITWTPRDTARPRWLRFPAPPLTY
jgi:hypothetical protein